MKTRSSSEEEIEKLLDPKRLIKLLALEKARRGLPQGQLAFIGMANVAKYYWCAMKSVLMSRQEELSFFAAYLQDRLRYSLELGLITRLPKTDKALLAVGDSIKLPDIETLPALKPKEELKDKDTYYATFTDKQGNRIMLFSPNLSRTEQASCRKIAKEQGMIIGRLEDYPMVRGCLLERYKAERYGSIRWNFQWQEYVIVGVPDGLTKSFVYEFKTSRNKHLASFLKPVALTQADLYGHFFRRPTKRVQIHTEEDDEIQTWEAPVDQTRVLEVLTNFQQIDHGKLIPQAPMKWKCTKCDFRQPGQCPLV